MDRNNKFDWVRCKCCGHKLFKMTSKPKSVDMSLEIKCHSCKTINLIDFRFMVGDEYLKKEVL